MECQEREYTTLIKVDHILQNILQRASSNRIGEFENALIDLRFVIERHTEDRYDEGQDKNYLLLFYDSSLISYHLQEHDVEHVKYFLFYMLFNFADRAVLTAKCIKVLYDRSSLEAIFAGIRYYMRRDDHATSELIFAVTNMNEEWIDDGVFECLLEEVRNNGGEYSKEIAKKVLDFRKT